MQRSSRLTLTVATAAAGLVTAASLQAAPAVTALSASVGPDVGASSPISLTKGGAKVTTLRRGTYRMTVRDRARNHNFYLFGPGITVRTGVGFVGTKVFTVTFKKGLYRFLCTVDPLTMRGSFRVT